MPATTAQTTLDAAIAAGFDRLSPRDVMLCILQGASGATLDYISVAGPPTAIPPAIANIVVDVNGTEWKYYGGAWH
jgi:hypothetical protein